ncbi:serine/threonine-protein kinase Chk1-like protein [Dinothrombium tinctorium]|uniref:non-specific serine/threonine protein kinase n=1 Tax=Dinothrombium tinctorium TaxID=1965070 RepID=A0A443RDV6_9ACAR|nr:serine/threonine-protein kinase Chk1-like protein [Dinothrombium tinctorium]
MEPSFSDEWCLLHILGEGAFGEVRLFLNRKTNEAMAAKMIDIEKHRQSISAIKKEIAIHKMLSHENIIHFNRHLTVGTFEYIFLEYASGGELFDRIEPDVGMSQSDAHKFFYQLIAGVEYLHSCGVAHRDLKPENLLLSSNGLFEFAEVLYFHLDTFLIDVIKISDFGMATIFRMHGKERKLTNKCGTLPYMAPELISCKEYRAEPIDIWSCGIILVALLAGELPWDEPSKRCVEFREWKEGKIFRSPWNKLDNLCLTLLKKILNPNEKNRFTLEDIKNHKWYKKSFNRRNDAVNRFSPVYSCKKLCESPRKYAASQPAEFHPYANTIACYSQQNQVLSFSQPTHPEDMIINTQLQTTQSSPSLNIYQRLVKRMTRFFMNCKPTKAFSELTAAIVKLNYSWKKSGPGILTISGTDRRNVSLVFKVNIIEIVAKEVLIDFRLSRGDGIEFKRHFLRIRESVHHLISKTPLTWSLAAATNALP